MLQCLFSVLNIRPFLFPRSTIRDNIIPHAVSWFTGEAAQDEDFDGIMDDDEDDDEDDEEDEDEDEDDEEDEDDDDGDKKVC